MINPGSVHRIRRPVFIGDKAHWMSLSFFLFLPLTLAGQVTPEEHAGHHPAQASGGPPQSEDSMMGGGMMDKMMEQMGAPKPKELYPSLMELPDLPMEKRTVVQREAHERMQSGMALLSNALGKLADVAANDDYTAMQEAAAQMREGLAQFESGLAAHRALAEGKAPRNVALQWFKREMNLLPPGTSTAEFHLWGMSPFHSAVMLLLVLFATAMIWLYFVKMRRAAALLERMTAAPATISGSFPEAFAPASAVIPAPPALAKPSKWTGKLRLANTFQETQNVKTFRFVNPEGGPLPFTYLPSQFLTLNIEPEGKPVKRSYTMASSPTQHNYLEITVKREDRGLVSRYLHDRLRIGDEITITAPSGNFVFTGKEHDNVLLIAGGVGITPMMSIIRFLTDQCWDKDIYLLFCVRTPEDIIFRGELEHLSKRHSNLHLWITVSRTQQSDWDGPRGRLTKETLQKIVPGITSYRAHICGPITMMDAVKAMLQEIGLPNEQIKLEAFGPAPKKPLTQVVQSGRPETRSGNVTFKTSNKSAPLPPNKTILEAADELGVDIENSCRAGSCGSCKVKLLEGNVEMDCEDALEPDEKKQGIILACQAKTTEDVVIEA